MPDWQIRSIDTLGDLLQPGVRICASFGDHYVLEVVAGNRLPSCDNRAKCSLLQFLAMTDGSESPAGIW